MLTVEYDGSEFAGWQIQPEERTIQGELERALKELDGSSTGIIASGRTDAGVHALGQVCHFKTTKTYSPDIFQKALNTHLPKDIRIIKSRETDDSFHSRYSAKRRTYRYYITCHHRALGRQYCWYVPYILDIDMMRKAAECLTGEHDFAAFAKAPDENGSYRSIVFSAEWKQKDNNFIFEIEAIRYFHNMIRIIVGTMVEVGRGKMSPLQFNSIFNSGDRRKAGMTAPAQGLILVSVTY